MEEVFDGDAAVLFFSPVIGVGGRLVIPASEFQNFLDDFLRFRQSEVHVALVLREESPELIAGHVGPTAGELGECVLEIIRWNGIVDLVLSGEEHKHFVLIDLHVLNNPFFVFFFLFLILNLFLKRQSRKTESERENTEQNAPFIMKEST